MTQLFPAGILKNTSTNTFHPIFFRPAPRPSEYDDDFCRFRSKAHHTSGFATQELATAHIKEQAQWKDSGTTWEWDGSGVPAITSYFSRKEHGF